MALGKCKECGGQVSSDAETCPHCGANKPLPRTSAHVIFWPAALLIAIVAVVAAQNNGKEPNKNNKGVKNRTCLTSSYIGTLLNIKISGIKNADESMVPKYILLL